LENIREYHLRVAANDQGLLLCWHFIFVSRELKPNKFTDDEDKINC